MLHNFTSLFICQKSSFNLSTRLLCLFLTWSWMKLGRRNSACTSLETRWVFVCWKVYDDPKEWRSWAAHVLELNLQRLRFIKSKDVIRSCLKLFARCARPPHTCSFTHHIRVDAFSVFHMQRSPFFPSIKRPKKNVKIRAETLLSYENKFENTQRQIFSLFSSRADIFGNIPRVAIFIIFWFSLAFQLKQLWFSWKSCGAPRKTVSCFVSINPSTWASRLISKKLLDFFKQPRELVVKPLMPPIATCQIELIY